MHAPFAFLRRVLLTITKTASNTVFVHQFPLLQSSPKSRWHLLFLFSPFFLTPLLTATFHLTWKQLDTKWKQHDYLLPIKIYKHLFLTCSSHTPLGLLSLAMPFLSNHPSVTTNKQAGNFNTISQHRKYWVLYRAMTSYLKHYFTLLVL